MISLMITQATQKIDFDSVWDLKKCSTVVVEKMFSQAQD